MKIVEKRDLAVMLRIISTCLVLLVFCPEFALSFQSDTGPTRWENAIRQFEEEDRTTPPPQGGILFLGSSSIRLWDLPVSFPKLQTINRGFGGSQIADSVYYAERIVFPYHPSLIVFYAGDNDIAAGKSPSKVLNDFREFAGIVHERMPATRIIFISIKPSLARWAMVEKMREANRLINQFCASRPELRYLDIDSPMIGDDGKPRRELFLRDGLHLNAKGYQLWSSLVSPLLTE